MKIHFYKFSGEKNRVDKEPYLEPLRDQMGNIVVCDGTLREETSILNPVITIQSEDFPTYNYAKIEEFNRYYYIDNIVSVAENLWALHMSVDVLHTYKDGIMLLNGFIERSENMSNPMIVDKKRIIEQGFLIEEDELYNTTLGFPDSETYEGDEFIFCMTGLGINAVEL